MNLLRLFLISITTLFLFACAEKKTVSIKEFHAENIQDFLMKMRVYSSVEGVLSIQYEGKNTLQGDASLRISNNQLLLRVYYLGFPAGEIYEENGEASSTLPIEKERIKQLSTSIRKGFLWWQGDFSIEENSESYILKEHDSKRIIIIDKIEFKPLRQFLNIDGNNILITYDNYSKIQTKDGTVINMPLKIEVLYKNRTLKINVERLKIKNA